MKKLFSIQEALIFETTLIVQKSKFISFLIPFPLYEEKFKEIKKSHPKARHYVYGYRYVNEFDQIVENQSDDGEPKGSSGPPTLAVLRGKNLINVAIITVRYFGGTKLGIGGLVRAYGDSANSVIKSAKLIPYEKKVAYSFSILYTHSAKVFHIMGNFKVDNVTKKFQNEDVLIDLEIGENKLEDFKLAIRDYIIKTGS